MRLTITTVAAELDTKYNCDCCDKLLPANKMVWLVDEKNNQYCYGKTCYGKIKKEILVENNQN